MVPHPGEVGYDTWPKNAWTYSGGADAWGGLAVDTRRGIVYIPTAAPKNEFYGGDRIGDDLFSDCLVALNARTGKLIWYYQMVHHDIWDYDNTAGPQLVTVTHDGKKIDAVAEAGKTGFLYVFDRVTGKPLWPIEERDVQIRISPEKLLPRLSLSPLLRRLLRVRALRQTTLIRISCRLRTRPPGRIESRRP